MKKFKIADIGVSVALITGFILCWLIRRDNSFFIGYLLVGSWQVLSMLVHAFNQCFTYKAGSRYRYHWLTFISLATLPLGSFRILLFAAPFMAVYYTYLCYHEVYVKMQRPLALLK